MRICAIASGSAGNVIYVGSGSSHIVIDAGLGATNLEKRLNQIGISVDQLSGIIVTHEHIDHVRGLKGLMLRGVEVYINPETLSALTDGSGRHILDDLALSADVRALYPGTPTMIGDVNICPFSVSHDAINPLGIVIENGSCRIGLATDLGYVNSLVLEHLKATNVLVIEANHDVEMLKRGRYPWPLKQRILGKTGHLSNEEAAESVRRLGHAGLSHVVLAHLSEDNNRPDIAISTVQRGLADAGLSHVTVSAAEQRSNGPMIDLS